MDSGERVTNTRDEHYALMSVLDHALHGAENCEMYALDAEEAGDDDLAAFFRNAQATQRQLAEQAKERLGIRDIVTPRGTVTPETAEVGTEVPPEGMVGPEASPTPRDIQPGTAPEPTPPLSGGIPPEGVEPRDVPRDVPPEDIEPGSRPPRDVPPKTRPR